MPDCSVLCETVVDWTGLNCVVLYCTMPDCSVLCETVVDWTGLNCVVLYCTMPDCSVPGFIQVRENWKRSGNLSGQGKSGKMQK